MSEHWSDREPLADMSDPINNILWALDQMLTAQDEGRYHYERIHIESDLRYLRAEARRAKRVLGAAEASRSDERVRGDQPPAPDSGEAAREGVL